MINNVTVIIRSVGERTEALCKKLILEQGVPEENLVIVKEAPFSAAMKKSFQIGIERELPWTLCIDADVLLSPNSIQQLINFGKTQENNVCEIQGMVLDKFFGGPRPAGNHLYRTLLLKKVLKNIPTEGLNVRPEYYTLNKMKKNGFPWYNVSLLVGLHDFEQYNQDIFRKSFVQAHKHVNYLDLFVTFWRDMAKSDLDYQVALWGLASGLKHFDKVYIDINQEYYVEEFKQAQISEKSKLEINKFTGFDVEKIIKEWQEPQKYFEKFSDRFGLKDNGVKILNRVRAVNFKQKINEVGYLRILPWVAGKAFVKLGNKICDIIE